MLIKFSGSVYYKDMYFYATNNISKILNCPTSQTYFRGIVTYNVQQDYRYCWISVDNQNWMPLMHPTVFAVHGEFDSDNEASGHSGSSVWYCYNRVSGISFLDSSGYHKPNPELSIGCLSSTNHIDVWGYMNVYIIVSYKTHGYSSRISSYLPQSTVISKMGDNPSAAVEYNPNTHGPLNSNNSLAKKLTDAAAAAAAAWPSLQSLSVPTTTTNLSSANSTKSSAQGYWNTISQAGSGWTNYSAAKSKYNEIVTAVSNIEARDNAYNSLTGLTTPTNTTVQATAKTAKDNADTYWSTIQSKTNSGWSNWSAAETKHTEVVEGYNNTVTRDTRLNKKADKTELNASNSKVRPEYTTPYTKGTADYTSIKSTLTALSKKLNS